MNCKRRTFGASVLGLGLIAMPPAAADELTLALDVPSTLGATTYLHNQTVRGVDTAYSLRFDGPGEGLDPAVGIDALLVLEDGSFLFSADSPLTIGATTFEPRDIVRYDTGSYSIHVDGGSLGLSEAANVDAVTRDDQGRLVLSLDEPEELFGSTYMPSDLLVLEFGDLSLLVAGSAMGLTVEDNVVGLDRDTLGWHLLSKEPTTVGTSTYLPGQIAVWDGASLELVFDAALPGGSGAVGLSFPGPPGDVDLLLLAKLPVGLELNWATGCSSEASDYAIYEGTLGDWTSHTPKGCSTSGETGATVVADPGDRYFLVVPRNGRYEGSYGRGSTGIERAQTAGSCLPLQRIGSCP